MAARVGFHPVSRSARSPWGIGRQNYTAGGAAAGPAGSGNCQILGFRFCHPPHGAHRRCRRSPRRLPQNLFFHFDHGSPRTSRCHYSYSHAIEPFDLLAASVTVGDALVAASGQNPGGNRNLAPQKYGSSKFLPTQIGSTLLILLIHSLV